MDDNQLVFAAARRVADIFHTYVTHDPSDIRDFRPTCQDSRYTSVNPFFRQTHAGLFLEFSIGAPASLWTPWGEWRFVNSLSGTKEQFDALSDAFMTQLTTKVVVPQTRIPDYGLHGPIHAVLSVDGMELPEPNLKEDEREFTPYQQAKAEWESLSREHATA